MSSLLTIRPARVEYVAPTLAAAIILGVTATPHHRRWRKDDEKAEVAQ